MRGFDTRYIVTSLGTGLLGESGSLETVDLFNSCLVLIDIFCRPFAAPPPAVALDVDDTCDRVHGRQQLSLFNAHYDSRCFLPGPRERQAGGGAPAPRKDAVRRQASQASANGAASAPRL